MASRSTPLKSVPRLLRPEIDRLLQHGALHAPVSDGLRAAAQAVTSLGIARITDVSCVRCANEEDYDFGPRHKHCTGIIELDQSRVEEGEWHCPRCERVVRPFANRRPKQQISGLRTEVDRAGVSAYVAAILAATGRTIEQPEAGVWTITGDPRHPDRAYVVVTDLLDSKSVWRRHDHVATRAVRFLIVDPETSTRFLNAPWLTPLPLSALIVGEETPGALLHGIAAPPDGQHPVPAASLPVFTTGARPIERNAAPATGPDRCFVVEFRGDELLINGVSALAPQAKSLLAIFRRLWEQFRDDVGAGSGPDDVAHTSLADLARFMEAGANDAGDSDAVRRAVNRLQETLSTAVRKSTGARCEREDIVEGATNGGGYRINPRRVAYRVPARWTALD